MRLKFELNEGEMDAVLRPYAEWGARLGRWPIWVSALAALLSAPVLAVTAGWGMAAWVLPVPFVVFVLYRFGPALGERQLKKMRRSPSIRVAVRQLQDIDIDDQGITTSLRGRFRRRCPWDRMTSAQRCPTCWIFRSRGGVFVVPDRAFPNRQSLAEFEALIHERVPASAWREPDLTASKAR